VTLPNGTVVEQGGLANITSTLVFPTIFEDTFKEGTETDLTKAARITPTPVIDYILDKIEPLRDYDETVFSESELEVMQEVAKKYAKKKFVVLIGGEHSVSIGSVQAQTEVHKNLSVLQLDAHADLRDEYYGSKYNHGCVMARIKEICPIVQVGIRSLDISEKKNIEPSRMFYAEKIIGTKNWQDQVIAKLTDKVYLTIDLDIFDPGILPSTGTPEPGGLGWYEVLSFIKKVIQKKNVIAFDVVELCPNAKEKSSDFLAAKLIYKILSYKFKE